MVKSERVTRNQRMDRMNPTTEMRHEESTERIFLRSAATTFQNVIKEGTSCSPMEAGVIAEKALEIFRLGDYNEDRKMQPGQMIWRAIDQNEPAGKPLNACVFKEIKLTVHNIEEDTTVHRAYGASAKRQQQCLRMTNEAFDQGTLLTQEDLAILLDSDVKTIRGDIKKLQAKHDILIPTRGNKKDIGPGITHRDRAVTKFLEGADPVAIARDMSHSLKAVERYIHSFCRIVYAQQQTKNSLTTALVVGVSTALVDKYLTLKDTYQKTAAYQSRIAEIEEVGTQFWVCQDGKKSPGQTKKEEK